VAVSACPPASTPADTSMPGRQHTPQPVQLAAALCCRGLRGAAAAATQAVDRNCQQHRRSCCGRGHCCRAGHACCCSTLLLSPGWFGRALGATEVPAEVWGFALCACGSQCALRDLALCVRAWGGGGDLIGVAKLRPETGHSGAWRFHAHHALHTAWPHLYRARALKPLTLGAAGGSEVRGASSAGAVIKRPTHTKT
jgi:hypothetical protein